MGTDIFGTIASYAELEEGWDSYGAPPIDARAIAAAKRLAVCPTSCGGVEFEWHGPDDTVIFTINAEGLLSEVYVSSTEWNTELEWERPTKRRRPRKVKNNDGVVR